MFATETLNERCFRLGLLAAAKDAEAERHWAAEADAAGRAAFERQEGNRALADSYDRERADCEACALDADAEAERLRSQAAAIRRSQRIAEDFASLFCVSTHTFIGG